MNDATNRLKRLQNVHHRACKCDLKIQATQPVFGHGNPNADIVFIGEAPGKDEDLQGLPFVGRAGKFLNEMLASVKMSRDDVYITNTVKYRPPENRDPTETEKLACRKWLLDELDFVKPKIIIFLGRIAMNNFLPEFKIGDVHGKLLTKKIDGFPTDKFIALYHPAAAMYNGALRETLVKDFKKIPKLLNNLTN